MPIDYLNNNYTDYSRYRTNASTYSDDSVDESQGSGSNYNAVFTDKTNKGVSVDDFLNLMVSQLRNQDFMNPVDDTQYVTQLAQFATMQSMQEMSASIKTNYLLSLMGQEVTAARFTVSGAVEKETGVIEKITLTDNEHAVYVNGKKFTLEQIMEYHHTKPAEPEEGGEDADDEAIDKTISDLYDLINEKF